LIGEGGNPEAEKLARRTLDIRRSVLGSEHPDTLASMSQVAEIMSLEGRFAEAEKLYRKTLISSAASSAPSTRPP
jgi:hypothetical protein